MFSVGKENKWTPRHQHFVSSAVSSGGLEGFAVFRPSPPPPRVVGRKVFNYKDRRTAVPFDGYSRPFPFNFGSESKKKIVTRSRRSFLEKSVPAHPFFRGGGGLDSLFLNFWFLVTQSLNTTIQRSGL